MRLAFVWSILFHGAPFALQSPNLLNSRSIRAHHPCPSPSIHTTHLFCLPPHHASVERKKKISDVATRSLCCSCCHPRQYISWNKKISTIPTVMSLPQRGMMMICQGPSVCADMPQPFRTSGAAIPRARSDDLYRQPYLNAHASDHVGCYHNAQVIIVSSTVLVPFVRQSLLRCNV